MNRTSKIDKRLIRRTWRKMKFSESFRFLSAKKISLNHRKTNCLKDSYKSSIWKIIIDADKKSFPVILKISKKLKEARPESTVERNIYRKAVKILQPFMPKVYFTKKNVSDRDLWVFMEYIEPIKGRVQYNPDHFDKIIPTLANLHAATMEDRFIQQEKLFGRWLPRYDSKEAREERVRLNELTLFYLDEAMKNKELNSNIQPYHSLLQALLKKGAEYFPEVRKAGCCIIHGDLHTANIACHDVNENEWDIKFIDWEGAKYAPCWFDLVNLIGVFLAYRKEWKDQEEAITHRCVHLYANEMRKNGVTFNSDPVELYEKAYLKKILEKSLYLQLNWAVTGKKEAKLLSTYLEKVRVFGKKFELY
ncbi:aminoglycoside phosphotransferase family protein [Paenibacillus faecalis]|uniref:aminoglycoside phosphotransferase family protein n=1 Tax=Paenibacillus faecalis TaxID=2079532 RepID=UPI001F274F04|nr:aminoglycoside phosphotransferase family protein [Paenibacillus faecalis]